MGTNSLFSIIILLAIGLTTTYCYKTGVFNKILPQQNSGEKWQKEELGWEKLKADPDPIPETKPIEEEKPQPKTQPKTQPRPFARPQPQPQQPQFIPPQQPQFVPPPPQFCPP